MDQIITGLVNLTKWDPVMMAKGEVTFDTVMGDAPDNFPLLIEHLVDETPTAIFDEMSGRNPKLCDVVLLILLTHFKKDWKEFSKDGLFISTALDNPIFSIKWDRPTKFKVQAHFQKLYEEFQLNKEK